MNNEKQPSYYAIIPATIRYDERLKYAERLFYGEITALIGKEGYCFASNNYFAELYGVIPGTISRWISHLSRLEYIKVELIKNDKKEIIERRIYITDLSCRRIVQDTYKQNSTYPYKQNCSYPMSQKAKDNNINIRIDRFFKFIIKKEKQNPEKLTEDEQSQFYSLLEKLELNYTEELLKLFTKENIDKLKIIIYALKELFTSNKKQLVTKVKREELIFLYDNCKDKQLEYENTSKEINNFFEYYYISLIRKLEKAT